MMKGRNANLIQLRNQHLIRRYYFWYEIQRLRLDDVWEELSTREIFLDIDYIQHLIRQNSHLLKEIRAAKPAANKVNEFRFSANNQSYVTGDLFSQVSC